MRRTWVIVGVAAAAFLSLCCFGILGFWYLHRTVFVFTVPTAMVLPRPELLDDETASLILWRNQDNTIGSMSVTVCPDINADLLISGGHLSGLGEGGSELDEQEFPAPPAIDLDNEAQMQALREAVGDALKEARSRSLTFSVKGGFLRDAESITVTPEDFRRLEALLKGRDILTAIRECWKDNPAVIKRLDALTAKPK